jgi:hypothetical protein
MGKPANKVKAQRDPLGTRADLTTVNVQLILIHSAFLPIKTVRAERVGVVWDSLTERQPHE